MEAALHLFTAGPWLGGEEAAFGHRELLVAEMEETFAQFQQLNESKNIMAVVGTPVTQAIIWWSTW